MFLPKILSSKVLLLNFLLLFTLQATATECQLSVSKEFEQENSVAQFFHGNSLSLQSYALLEALIAKTSCTLESIPLPNQRAMKMLEAGSLSVMVGMSKTEERESTYYFIGSYHKENIVVIGSFDMQDRVKNLNDILALEGGISAIGGAYYGAKWEQALQNDARLEDRLLYLSDNQRKFSMLLLNRIDFSLGDEQVVDELFKEKSYKERFIKLFTLHENPVYFAFSKKAISVTLYEQLTKEWLKMQMSGEIDTIKHKYQNSA
jgi:polar amino acid transport system substrate-binding protein